MIIEPSPCDITFSELCAAYYDCRKNKRNSDSALLFELNLEDNLCNLYNDLLSGNYRIGYSICFVVKKPRIREIWAADFRDRIVHHLVYNRIKDKFNRSFTADSCACIPGRGTLYGAKRLEKHIRSFTNNWDCDYYYMKCDLANFFVSINKDVLWGIIEPKLPNDWVKGMVRYILYHDPRENVVFNSSPEEMEEVPLRKRLLLTSGNRGLPIGNLTSQFFANVLMDVLDKFVKHVLMVEKYIRYVDDFIFLGKTTRDLIEIHHAIQPTLNDLGVELNDKKTIIQPIKRGVSFVGQTIYPFRRVPLKNTYWKCYDNIFGGEQSDINCTISYIKQAPNSYNLLNRLLHDLSLHGYEIDRNRNIVLNQGEMK